MKNEIQEKIIGNLTKDAEVRVTAGGKELAKLSIAVGVTSSDRQKREAGETFTVYRDITVFNEAVEICKTLNRGARVKVFCTMQMDEWPDRQTGEKRNKESFISFDVEHLTPATTTDDGPPPPPQSERQTPQNPTYTQAPASAATDDNKDDIPF